MAKDDQVKKRKASTPNDEVSKVEKVKKSVVEAKPAKKRKATEDASPVTVKKSKTPTSTSEEVSKPQRKKKATATEKVVEVEVDEVKAKDSASKKLNGKSKSAQSVNSNLSSEDEVEKEEQAEDLEAAGSESEDDDQTEAFLKGFESDEEEEEELATPVAEVPSIDKKVLKKAKKAAKAADDDRPGVVYIGRIPHGFYENEMREYFKQFGDIIALRLARNRKTGASKHIAWIKFESAAVAEIVAKTMDNYLLFNHILKVKVVPDEQVPENLFVGANKRFKKVPWNKIVGRKLAQGASETTWNKRIEKEGKRRQDVAKKLKAIGYEFEAPKLKLAKASKLETKLAITANEDEVETAAIEAPPAEVSKKSKKAKAEQEAAASALETTAVEEVSEVVEPTSELPEKKAKKKKSKSSLVEKTEAPAEIANEEAKKSKKRKDKKAAP